MVFGSFVLAGLSAAVIVFSSTLFAVLGFEYSALMALALSAVCGFVAAAPRKKNGMFPAKIGAVIGDSLILSLVPFIVSVFSLPFLPNCAFWDGVLFYLEIAVPSAMLGGLFGLACSWLTKSKKRAILLFIGFWCVTLFLSFLPGYYNPQLYTYGWQYGFFPGITWDAPIELTNAYLAFRLENVVWVIFALSLADEMRLPRRPRMWFVIPGVIALALFGFNDWFHITTSHDRLDESLSKTDQQVPNCTIYYAPNSLTVDELEKIDRDIRWYLHAVEERFALSANHPPIAIYIYPSSDAMFDLIGTRTASLAKPWLSEVHIAKENLESLKHELTHVLLREKGVFPFYASWSTGVTEGAAMSVEPEYDGIYTLDEHAARILQMHYASGVRKIMSFSGFAANASEKSYVLVGSFSRYLLSTYGSQPFDRVYSSLDWRKEYGKPLDSLEAEWKRWLEPMMTPMDASDSEHFRYYYDRSSIIYNPCLRKIGKLERKGANALQFHRYNDAENFYRDAIDEGAGISALFGVETALLRSGNWRGALAALDTTRTAPIRKQRVVLDLQRADLHFIAGDTALADSLYTSTESVKLNSERFLFGYAGNILMHADPDSIWRGYLEKLYTHSLNSDSLLRIMDSEYVHPLHDTFDRISFAIRILLIDHRIHSGELVRATMIGHLQSLKPEGELTENDSLALSLYWQQILKLGLQRADENVEYVCPIKYRRAAKEMGDEINAEWQFLQSNPAERGHGTNP